MKKNRTSRLHGGIIAGLMALALIDSCSLLPPASTIADILPRETDVPGWMLIGRYRISNRKKIDALNSLYAEYGPIEYAVAEYHRVSDRGTVIRVEIVKFRSPLDAFGVFSRERGMNCSAPDWAHDVYYSGHALFSLRGEYCCRIEAVNCTESEKETLEQFNAVIRQNVPAPEAGGPLPVYIRHILDNGPKCGVIYYKKRIESIPALDHAFVIRRAIAGRDRDVLYARFDAPFEAEGKFQELLKKGNGSWVLSRVADVQYALRAASGSDYIAISQYKQWIFGVLNADTMNEGTRITLFLLTEIKNSIRNGE